MPDGWLRKVLGDPEQATLRASYGVSFNSDGLSFFTGVYSGNPGSLITTNRTATSTQFPLVPPGESWPVLLREPERLGPSPEIPAAPGLSDGRSTSPAALSVFHPNFKTPYARSFSAGVQRPLGRQMAVEVRYVGTRLVDGTATENWNEVNWTTNGFLDEFKLAQANLMANLRGRTRHLLRLLRIGYRHVAAADLSGELQRPRADPNSDQRPTPAPTGRTRRVSPSSPFAIRTRAARRTRSSPRRSSARTWRRPGYPRIFFVLNPDVGNAKVRTNGDRTEVRLAADQLRRMLSDGLAVDANYVFAKRYASRLDTLREERTLVRSTSGVPHALKLTAIYELPFGRGRQFGARHESPGSTAIAGGWALNLAPAACRAATR